MRTLMRPALDAKCKNNISAQFFCYIAWKQCGFCTRQEL
jgi:hypothetical protein